jgi:hypothetical protein
MVPQLLGSCTNNSACRVMCYQGGNCLASEELSFRLYPGKQVTLEWNEAKQDISIIMQGRWIDTILYEIPILALVSESYFRFVDTDWDYVGQYGITFRDLINWRTRICEGGAINAWRMCIFWIWVTQKTRLPYSWSCYSGTSCGVKSTWWTRKTARDVKCSLCYEV